jgi:ceramide kinase
LIILNHLIQETERANHAYDFIQSMDLDNIDGIVSVGGDGLFSEIFTSLLNRTQIENNVNRNDYNSNLVQSSKIVGIIPAGK